MNHTHYFSDEERYQLFAQKAKASKHTISKALNEALELWLQKNQTWSSALHKKKPLTDSFRFEHGRLTTPDETRDPFA